jgi:uncharacterized protein (DUF983 family)
MQCPACGEPLLVQNQYNGNQYCMKCGEEIPLTKPSPLTIAPTEAMQGPTQEDQERTRVFLRLFVGLFIVFLIDLFVRYGNVIQLWLKIVLNYSSP